MSITFAEVHDALKVLERTEAVSVIGVSQTDEDVTIHAEFAGREVHFDFDADEFFTGFRKD